MNLDYVLSIDEWEDESDLYEQTRLTKRYIRDAINPVETLNDEQFRRRFRFRKETVINDLVPLCINVSHQSNRGLPVPALIKVLVALRFYATSSSQAVCGDLFSLSQSSVHRIVKEVSENLCRTLGLFVKMPSTTADIHRTWREFYEQARFPEVIGLVDGTHVPISSPGGDTAEVFRNRKGFFSLNIQIVCGPVGQIFHIVCRWPGSAHDSRIFNRSSVNVLLEENHRTLGHLLGDNGYAQKPYLFTPVTNPTTEPERRYNISHKRTRSIVERTIGRWKKRFPCLYLELQTKLRNTLRIIPACAILHNIGINARDTWDEDVELIAEVPTLPVASDTGNTIRNAFIIRHFS